MQKIRINKIKLIAPNNYQFYLSDVLKRAGRAFDKLFCMDSDLDLTFDDENNIILSCSGVNENAVIKSSKAWVGDDDCQYGMTQVTEYESDGFIDDYDIKKALQKEFAGWDIDLEDVTCEMPKDISLEECVV